jgi:hypothetical protein
VSVTFKEHHKFLVSVNFKLEKEFSSSNLNFKHPF